MNDYVEGRWQFWLSFAVVMMLAPFCLLFIL